MAAPIAIEPRAPTSCSGKSARGSTPQRRRSEERRVGKECRSRCDWSSDVCSSDLSIAIGAVDGGTYRYRAESADLVQWEIGTGVYTAATQIGRASCRERV